MLLFLLLFLMDNIRSLPISEPRPAQNLMIADFTEASLIAEWDAPNEAQTDHTRYEASIQVLISVNYLCFNLTC